MLSLVEALVNKKIIILASLGKFATKSSLIEYLTSRAEIKISKSYVIGVLQNLELLKLISIKDDELFVSPLLLNIVRDCENLVNDLKYIEEQGLKKPTITTEELAELLKREEEEEELDLTEVELEKEIEEIDREFAGYEIEERSPEIERIMEEFDLSPESARICLELYKDKDKIREKRLDSPDIKELLDKQILIPMMNGVGFEWSKYNTIRRIVATSQRG